MPSRDLITKEQLLDRNIYLQVGNKRSTCLQLGLVQFLFTLWERWATAYVPKRHHVTNQHVQHVDHETEPVHGHPVTSEGQAHTTTRWQAGGCVTSRLGFCAGQGLKRSDSRCSEENNALHVSEK